MKTKSIFRTLLTGTAILTFATLITSCKKNDVDESGSANVKVVNAAPSSSAQSFFLANNTVVDGGLDFGDATDYIAANSGKNLEAQFRNAGTTTAYGTGKFDLDNGHYYTVYLVGDGQNSRVKLFEDDLSSPASGQAKVKFIHLSDAAPANIDIKNGAGENLAVNLARDNSSAYLNVAPGILRLQVTATGSPTSIANFDLSAFTAGKIYTVYVTGSSTANINVTQIVHN